MYVLICISLRLHNTYFCNNPSQNWHVKTSTSFVLNVRKMHFSVSLIHSFASVLKFHKKFYPLSKHSIFIQFNMVAKKSCWKISSAFLGKFVHLIFLDFWVMRAGQEFSNLKYITHSLFVNFLACQDEYLLCSLSHNILLFSI